MGGAFIAVADDATAASWNPAGLTQLRKPEFSFAYSYFKRQEDFSLPAHPESSGSHSVTSDDLNYFSIAYPFKLWQRNMIVSLNYQLLYDFDRDFDFRVYDSFDGARIEQKMNFRQQGKLRTLSPAYAIQITPHFSIGVTLNFWTDKLSWSNGWESESVINGYMFYNNRLPTKFNVKYKERYSDFSGFNLNIGFLWNVTRMVTIGSVLKTPFTAHVQHTRRDDTVIRNPNSTIIRDTFRSRENVDLEMPLSFGFGIALRCTDAFTVSLDVYHTRWDKFVLENSIGERISPITAAFTRISDVSATTQVRLGTEYLFILTNTVIPVRCGLFYDPEPANNHPEDFWGFSLGTGISIKNILFDIAYQYRTGNNVGKQALTGMPSTEADVTQHLVIASLIYHFQ
jgi:long-subunit fatty acid transport protein